MDLFDGFDLLPALMSIISVTSSSSTPESTPSTSSDGAHTPSVADGNAVTSGSPIDDIDFEHLTLGSVISSSGSAVSSPNSTADATSTPATENISIAALSSSTPSAPIFTPRTTISPPNGTPSPGGSPPPRPPAYIPAQSGFQIDFSLSISANGGNPQSPFQFQGADVPMPSVEVPFTPTQRSRSGTPSISLSTSPVPVLSTRPVTGMSDRPTPSPSAEQRDGSVSISSPLRNLQLVADAAGSDTPSRLLSPERAESQGSPSRPSPSRRRRSPSQNNPRPHQVSDEEPPEDGFHNPDFQRSLNDARAVMSRMERTLGSSNIHLEPDSTIRRLREKAGELANFQCPPKRIVGFVGDSGVGKSSLLNSLLDHKELARASNSGAACTCVVTEYRFHAQDDFAVEVDIFNRHELKSQLSEMVQAYRRQHMHPPSGDREEQKDVEERAKVARDTFHAMFRGPGRLDGGRFLHGSSEETIVNTMLQWAEELGPSDISGRTIKSARKSCSDFIIKLTSERAGTNTQSPSIWPYIKKIRVFLNAHILSKGLVLVDLPGLRDLNSARQNITERYILECDEIFAVCCIGRAVTDVGVKTVFDLARQARLSNVGIVCTKSDDIRANEAKTDWKGSKARAIQERIDRVDTVGDELAEMQHQIDELAEIEEDNADDLLPDEHRDLQDLRRRAETKRKALTTHKYELKRYLITTRNEMVKKELFDQYKNTIRGGGYLRVFCVSNTMYWDHRTKPRDRALPFLELSGIIALRKHCVAMVADSQLRIATHYMNNDIRSLISSVELWVHSGAGTETAERKVLVRETLDVIEKRLKRDLSGNNSPYAKLATSFAGEFTQRVYERRRIREWTRSAEDVSDEWSGWHHSTYSAFCRNYGNHCTPAVGSHNWNKEAMRTMVQDMMEVWDSFEQFLTEERNHAMKVDIEEVLEWTMAYLDNELGEDDPSANALQSAIQCSQNMTVASIEDLCEEFQRALGTLKKDAFSSHRTSMMGQGMEAAYRGCISESGRGSDSRRKSIISNTLSDTAFFEKMMKNFKKRFRKLAEDLENSIRTAVEAHLVSIGQTMDIVRDENVIAESERDGEFRKRVEQEVGRVRESLDSGGR